MHHDPEVILRKASQAHGAVRRYARHYGRWKLRLDPMYRHLAGDAGAWGRVLDAGCGPGVTASIAAARGDVSAYLGVDLDAGKLRAARAILAGLNVGDAWRIVEARLPLEPAQVDELEATPFDTVLLLDVLHYWPPDQQRAMLTQLGAMLRPGGVMLLRDGIAAGDRVWRVGVVAWGEWFTTRVGLNPSVSRLHFPTADELTSLLEGAGLTVTERIPTGGANQLWRAART